MCKKPENYLRNVCVWGKCHEEGNVSESTLAATPTSLVKTTFFADRAYMQDQDWKPKQER
jgi:hypothetical protein